MKKKIGRMFLFGLVFVFRFIPWRIAYLISDFLFFVGYRLFSIDIDRIRRNVNRCFPDEPAWRQAEIEREVYAYRIDYIIEFIKATTSSRASLCRRVKLKLHPDMKVAAGDTFPPCILWHWDYGCLDLLPHYPLMLGCEQLFVAVTPFKHEGVERLLKRSRERLSAATVHKNCVARTVHRGVLDGKGFAFVLAADSLPSDGQGALVCDFFSQPVRFYSGPERLVERHSLLMFYAEMRRVSRGHYEVSFVRLESSTGVTGELTQQAAHCYEAAIKRDPALCTGFWLSRNAVQSILSNPKAPGSPLTSSDGVVSS